MGKVVHNRPTPVFELRFERKRMHITRRRHHTANGHYIDGYNPQRLTAATAYARRVRREMLNCYKRRAGLPHGESSINLAEGIQKWISHPISVFVSTAESEHVLPEASNV